MANAPWRAGPVKLPSRNSSEYARLRYLEAQKDFDNGKQSGNYHSV